MQGDFTNWEKKSSFALEAKNISSVQISSVCRTLARYPSNVGPLSLAVVKTPLQVAAFYVKAFSSLSYYHYIKLCSLTSTYKVSINYSSSTAKEIALILEEMSDGIFCRFLEINFVLFCFPG